MSIADRVVLDAIWWEVSKDAETEVAIWFHGRCPIAGADFDRFRLRLY